MSQPISSGRPTRVVPCDDSRKAIACSRSKPMQARHAFDVAAEAFGLDQAGVDRVHPHAFLDADVRHRLGEVQQCDIHRAADGELRRSRARADADDVDDAAVGFAQMRPGGARGADIAVELQRETVLPVVLGQREEIGALGGAGVVHQDVEPAERRDRGIDSGLHSGGFAQVAGEDAGAVCSRERGDAVRHLVQLRPVARGEADLHAFPRQFLGDRRADAAARAGDQRGLAAQVQVHVVSLPPMHRNDAGIQADGQTTRLPQLVARSMRSAMTGSSASCMARYCG